MRATTLQARPAFIELAAAILIVSGVLGLVGTIGAASDLPSGAELVLVITAALNLGSIAIGVLVRYGRAWLLDVNYVAVLGFLDLVAGAASGLALLLGIADVARSRHPAAAQAVVRRDAANAPAPRERPAPAKPSGRWRLVPRDRASPTADYPLTPPTARPPTR